MAGLSTTTQKNTSIITKNIVDPSLPMVFTWLCHTEKVLATLAWCLSWLVCYWMFLGVAATTTNRRQAGPISLPIACKLAINRDHYLYCKHTYISKRASLSHNNWKVNSLKLFIDFWLKISDFVQTIKKLGIDYIKSSDKRQMQVITWD